MKRTRIRRPRLRSKRPWPEALAPDPRPGHRRAKALARTARSKQAPDQSGPVHKYVLSSPGCWALYGSVLTWKHTPAGGTGPAAQRIVDTYAAQHATNSDRRNRQSVALHLMSLCASLEQEISGTRTRRTTGD